MKTSILLALFVISPMLRNNERTGPEQAVGFYLTALFSNDFETAKKLATPESAEYIGLLNITYQMSVTSDNLPHRSHKISAHDIRCEVAANDTSALCRYEIHTEGTVETYKDSTNLVRRREKWLIDETSRLSGVSVPEDTLFNLGEFIMLMDSLMTPVDSLHTPKK